MPSDDARHIPVLCCPTVTIAALVIFLYAWLVPVALWGFLTWRQGTERQMGGYTFLETVCVYGYSLFIYIPTSVSPDLPLGCRGFSRLDPPRPPLLNTHLQVTKNELSTPPLFSHFQVLWIIPFDWLRWALILVAIVISGSVLVLTFWPVVRDDTKVAAVATVATIVVLHTLLAIGCKVSGRRLQGGLLSS